MKKIKQLLIWLIIGLSLCGNAHASAGLPMLEIVWPVFGILLIPMIALKFWYFKKHFQTEPGIRLLRGITITNTFGALMGVPMTWVVLGGIEIIFNTAGIGSLWATGFWKRILSVTLEAPWLMFYPSEYYWMIPVACMVLLIPFFIISTLSEYLVLHRYFLQHHDESIIKTVTQRGNALCYVFMYIMAFSWLTFNLMQR